MRYRLENGSGIESYHQFLQSFLKHAEKAEFSFAKSKDLSIKSILTLKGFVESKESKQLKKELNQLGKTEDDRIKVPKENIEDLRFLIRNLFYGPQHLLSSITDLEIFGEEFYVETDPYLPESESLIYYNKEFEEEINEIRENLRNFDSELKKLEHY